MDTMVARSSDRGADPSGGDPCAPAGAATPSFRAPSAPPQPFRSILFDGSDASSTIAETVSPDVLSDLNIDQIVNAITAGRDEYDLKPFFFSPLHDVEAIHYRHAILRDLENPALFGQVQTFAKQMRAMRDHLAKAAKRYYVLQKQRWFLDAVDIYCEAVGQLARDLADAELRSRGFQALRDHLAAHTESEGFTTLRAETERLQEGLAAVRYCLRIKGNRITVAHYESEADYSEDVLGTFEKFRQGAPKERRFTFPSGPDMDHVEAAILERVARLYPELFSSLGEYCRQHRNYLDPTIARFDREVQFYVSYLDHIGRLKPTGLAFCYPDVTDRSKEVCGREVFDLALADRLVRKGAPVVANDFYLKDAERIIVVTGPNQGGKTTFARTFGQLHHLASIGCPVPGREARLFLFDRLLTHFDREEDLQNQRSKLEDDLVRMREILARATSRSILIMNESLSSTTLSDALFLGREILGHVIERDLLSVSVTFLDELTSLGDATVSMVSTVDPDDPARRTYKILRSPANGLAYAIAIAEKYHLTYEGVRRRVGT